MGMFVLHCMLSVQSLVSLFPATFLILCPALRVSGSKPKAGWPHVVQEYFDEESTLHVIWPLLGLVSQLSDLDVLMC